MSLGFFGVLSFALLVLSTTGCSEDPSIIDSGENGKSPRSDRLREDGEFVFVDGSTYVGEVVDGNPDGFGQRRFLNNDVYQGDFRNGSQNGEGIMSYRSDPSLNRYDGAWAADTRHGDGTLEYADGSFRKGLWDKDSFERGILQTADGTTYEGIWDGDAFLRGSAKYPDGSSFTGSWVNGDFHEGTLNTAEKDKQVGAFREGLQHGFGSLERGNGNGESYVGEFQEDLYHGVGHLKYPDGRIYAGQFADGKPHGKGWQSDPSGVKYVGSWKSGERHGSGALSFTDGSRFTGDFEDGLAVDGQYFWADGRVTQSYQDENGEWKDR